MRLIDANKVNPSNPEDLPLVQELRAKLERITAERDALKMNPPVRVESNAFELALRLANTIAERDAALTRIKELERCGKWDDSLDGITPYCSVCGCTHNCLKRKPLYCPNCGAKMDLNGV